MDPQEKPASKLPPNFETAIRPHSWLPGVSGNPGGRPRKFMTHMKSDGYTKNQVMDTIKTLLACRADELKEVAQDTSATVLERTVAHAIGLAMAKGSMHVIEALLTRAYEAPKETIENLQQFTGPMQIEIITQGPPIALSEADVTDVK